VSDALPRRLSTASPETDARATTDQQEPARIPGQPSRFAAYQTWVISGGTVVAFLIVWEAVASARFVREMFLPGPSDIINAFRQLIAGGELGTNILVSSQELALGYSLAVLVGLPLGLAMGWYRPVHLVFDPFVSFFYSMPRVAVVPLLIIWFGIGINSKIALVFLGAVFSIIINTIAGVRNVDASLVRAARSFGATDPQLFRTVVLPGSVPFVLAGLRLGLGHALISVVVGEMIAARAGIGLMMAEPGATFQTAKVFAGLIMVAGSGVILSVVLQRVESHFQSWMPRQH
jgi:NitT/TauT family transport system permease protein